MSIEAVIASAIRKAVSSSIPVLVTEGVVLAVDRSARTCDVERDGKTELFAVRLNAFLEAGDEVITIYPKIGSKVLCVMVENDKTDTYILASTDIEEVSGKIGGIKVEWTIDGFVFNDGLLGGMVKPMELKTQLDKLTARVDGIISAITSGVPIAQDGGIALQQTIVASLNTLIDKEDFSRIENEKVKH
ncbi:hypothetical protein [Williamwhitmania taraxaci]|uniref:Uncharacterized protein n=1 Tax=Williamwhitmania taraxaci TaxID=1640674 RepID=A0A1G6MAR7_9BACT|nr:hypothetical protein [Williamwhitmania taraxaci]SDC52521.1 hypothetical protein SAMN05216323_103518 [Williamwhitmania taraxaci]